MAELVVHSHDGNPRTSKPTNFITFQRLQNQSMQGWWHVNTSLAKTLYVFVFTLQDSTPTRDFHNIYIYFFYVFYFIFKINTSKLLKNIKNTCFFHIKCTFKKHLKTILNTFQTPSKQVKSYGSPSGIHNHTYALAQRSLLA